MSTMWSSTHGPVSRIPSTPSVSGIRACGWRGMTFDGGPWTDHGRKVFAYDPVGKRMILTPSSA